MKREVKTKPKSVKESSGINVFTYIKMIELTKEIPEFDAEFEKIYSPFMVNRYFSLHKDESVLIANAINKNYNMSKRLHFLFMHSMIRKGKRPYSKWPKRPADAKIQFIMEEYNYSYRRAKEASVFITDDQITEMKAAKSTGGVL